jgi:hypothetical protein
MYGFTMFFTTHIDIATFAQNEERSTSEHNKPDRNFPHTISFKKKGSQGEPVTPLAASGQGVNSAYA